MLWDNLFVLPVSIWEKIIRALIVYVFLVIGLRLAGKRELAQVNTFDLVVLLTLSNTVQNAIIGNDNSLLGGIIGGSTLLIANYILVSFLFKNPKLNKVLEGEADVLITNGVLQKDKLVKELITLPELEIAARKQGFTSLDEIETAILEPGGAIVFQAKKGSSQLQILNRIEQLTESIKELKNQLSNK